MKFAEISDEKRKEMEAELYDAVVKMFRKGMMEQKSRRIFYRF